MQFTFRPSYDRHRYCYRRPLSTGAIQTDRSTASASVSTYGILYELIGTRVCVGMNE